MPTSYVIPDGRPVCRPRTAGVSPAACGLDWLRCAGMAKKCAFPVWVLSCTLALLPWSAVLAEDQPQPEPKQKPDAAAPKAAEEPPEEPDPPPPDIFAAAKSGNLEAVKKFLQENPALLNAKTRQSDTPLHWAASCGHVEVVRFLLSKLPDVNAKNITGSTPLHMACRISNKAIVELLLASKADVNARTEGDEEDDETPLHIAVRKHNTEIAELLLKNKADVNAKLRSGDRPMDVAKHIGRLDMRRLLRKYGATDMEEE